jgi:CheY-like chemotaxis protein
MNTTIHQADECMPTSPTLIGSPPDHTKKPQGSLIRGHQTSTIILMADDDADDCLLAKEAWEEIESGHELRFVHDGQEVLDYVLHQGPYTPHQSAPRPGIILLDLNMPKKNGHEVLGVIKSNNALRTIPIIVFTTTKHIDEVIRAYKEGANAFMTKPTSFEGYRNTLKAIDHFWLHLVQLPI